MIYIAVLLYCEAGRADVIDSLGASGWSLGWSLEGRGLVRYDSSGLFDLMLDKLDFAGDLYVEALQGLGGWRDCRGHFRGYWVQKHDLSNEDLDLAT